MASTINASTSSGIVQTADTSGVLQLQTASTTAVTVDASQNVGIGTNSPSVKLQVDGGASAELQRYNSSNTAPFVGWYVSGTRKAYQQWDSAYGWILDSEAASTNIVFRTQNAERMRIDNSGNVLVGATSEPNLGWTANNKFYVESSTSDYMVHFRSTASTPYTLGLSFSTAPNNTSAYFVDARDSSAQRFAVVSNGGIRNYSANNVNLSDEREKKDIQLAGSYLDKICAIPVKTFLFNDQTDTDLNLGVIAQDVQAVAPELVTESNWGSEEEPEKLRLSIYQTDLQYALMKCIQEQQTIINDLKARITALEGAK